MEIRKSREEDIRDIMSIYAAARRYMAEHGNVTQWAGGYPSEELIRSDISNNNSYVIVENGRTVGTFVFIIGDDPTYSEIRNGSWHHNCRYGTIHRLGSDGSARGVARACFDYCAKQSDYLRVDTHADNITMQTIIKKFGFRECGNIYVEDGSERIAYDYMNPSAGETQR